MEAKHKHILKSEIEKLILAGLYDSAETLLSFYISSLNATSQSSGALLSPDRSERNNPNNLTENSQNSNNNSLGIGELYEIYGDILYLKKEYKHALYYFRQVIQMKRINKSRTNSNISTPEDATIIYKECKCQFEFSDPSTVLRDLELIPSKLRDVKTNYMLGDLYKTCNLKKHAITSYREALLQQPTSIEIIENLINLGVESSELIAIIDESLRDQSSSELFSIGWLHSLIIGLTNKRNCEYDKSLVNFSKLNSIFPKNGYILTQTASLLSDSQKLDQAMPFYRQIRRANNTIVKGMDIFGLILLQKEDDSELNRLTNEVLDSNMHHQNGWMLAAMYCEVKGETDKALAFMEKAIQIEPRCSAIFKLKGRILFAHDNFEQALIAYSQANSLDKDMASYIGIIQTQLALGKLKDAVNISREAVTEFPRSSSAYLMMGSVFAKSTQGASECIRAFAKSLKLNPANKAAATSMAQALIAQGKLEEAVDCLVTILSKVSCGKLRLLLAKTQVSLGRHHEAIENLHISISLSPKDSAEASQELENIESVLRVALIATIDSLLTAP
eukprot:gene11855-15861_t